MNPPKWQLYVMIGAVSATAFIIMFKLSEKLGE